MSVGAVALTIGLLVQPASAAGENNQPAVASLEQIRKLADEGNAEAQYKLGRMYEEGLGLPQDYKEAAKWYLKAAEKGNAQAQYKMGTHVHAWERCLQRPPRSCEMVRKSSSTRV